MNKLGIRWRWIPALMNVIGLGIAFAVFLILMSQIWWDFRYDRFKGGKDVYIVDYPSSFDDKYTPYILRPSIQKIKDCSPDIEAACDYSVFKKDELGMITFKDKDGEYETAWGINYGTTETSVLDVFNISLLVGSKEDFAAKGDALISESTARQYFPDRDPIGETFVYEWRNEGRIVGVYKDRKENETMVNGILVHEGNTDLELPNSHIHCCYVKLAPGADITAVREAVGKVSIGDWEKDHRLTRLHPYWFLRENDLLGRTEGGNKTMCYVLLTIALLFLAVASFNYINFAMAAIPFTIKDINTRKVYGAPKSSLVFRQLIRTALIVGLSFLAGILAMRTLSGTQWATFLSGSMAPGENIPVVLIGGALAVVITLIAGLIPAFYSTSFQPALILKGTFAMTAKGGGLRTVTLVLQHVLSFIFIISALILQRQTTFMAKNNALGFDYDLVLKMESHGFRQVKDIAERLKDIPGVVDVTRGESPIEKGMSSMSEIRDNDNVVQYSFRSIAPEYPGFFKLKLTEGRLPMPGEKEVALINESFRQAVPSLGVGKTMQRYDGNYTIIGALEDFHARSLQHSYSPLVFFVNDEWYFNSFMMRVQPDADVEAVLSQAKKIYTEMGDFDNDYDIKTGFLNKDIESLYEQESRQTRLIKLSSLLSLVIALIGILGLVWFDTRFMRKEVAIRKVNGATSHDILSMINTKYIIISVVSFAIAAPIAYAICQRWMSNFAFRTNIPAWIFILAFFAVMALTLLTVTLQSWRAANANPVDSLKNE